MAHRRGRNRHTAAEMSAIVTTTGTGNSDSTAVAPVRLRGMSRADTVVTKKTETGTTSVISAVTSALLKAIDAISVGALTPAESRARTRTTGIISHIRPPAITTVVISIVGASSRTSPDAGMSTRETRPAAETSDRVVTTATTTIEIHDTSDSRVMGARTNRQTGSKN